MNPRDILSWQHYISTPWSIVANDDDDKIETGWTQAWPLIGNNPLAYCMVTLCLDKMNVYKNCFFMRWKD